MKSLFSDTPCFRGGVAKIRAASTATVPAKKPRLNAADGMRFFLILHIVLGHFLHFAGPSDLVMKFFAQINVTVGAFFALSGYVSAYTTSNTGALGTTEKFQATGIKKWILSKIFGYYPLYLLVLLLASPMFLMTNFHYGGPVAALVNTVMSCTLIQAWFPNHAEGWNASTWFLSAMTFGTLVSAVAMEPICKMDKKDLKKAGIGLWLATVIPRLAYAWEQGCWQVVEGMTSPKAHPALAMFNFQRFHPLVTGWPEMLLGMIACRWIMMNDAEFKENPTHKGLSNGTILPIAGLIGVLLARATGVVPAVSDLLVRSVVFVPLFLCFVMASHRQAVAGKPDMVNKFLAQELFSSRLAGLAFPIYIVHGPLGQLFYKKYVATKVFGQVLQGPVAFAAYLALTASVAYAIQELFLKNKAVGRWSKKQVERLSA